MSEQFDTSTSEEAAPPSLDVTIHTKQLLYRFLPVGSFTLSFAYDNESVKVNISGSSCRCCSIEGSFVVGIIRICRQPICNVWSLLMDATFSFVLAFLFHLIPAVIWGPERSLGSSSNHIIMGLVWFFGWPVWFIFMMIALRPWGIELVDCDGSHFVPFASRKQASDVVVWWQNRTPNVQLTEPPQKPRLIFDAWFIFGWFFFLFLIVNMVVTATLVMQCSNRGCCIDDEETLECCVETKYPDC